MIEKTRRDYVFNKIDELAHAIQMDSYNLSVVEQTAIERKIDELRTFIQEYYEKKVNNVNND